MLSLCYHYISIIIQAHYHDHIEHDRPGARFIKTYI